MPNRESSNGNFCGDGPTGQDPQQRKPEEQRDPGVEQQQSQCVIGGRRREQYQEETHDDRSKRPESFDAGRITPTRPHRGQPPQHSALPRATLGARITSLTLSMRRWTTSAGVPDADTTRTPGSIVASSW